MKSIAKITLFTFSCLIILLSGLSLNSYSEELFKNYVVKADEVLYRFAKQNLSDQDYLTEFLKFNSINAADIDANKAKFKDLGLNDGDILLIPSLDILKSIKKAKTDAEKNELVQKFKKIKHSDFYVKISELKNKMKEGGNVTERGDKISKDAKKK
ncbi:MAG TPA: hypothetical protein PK467_10555 [Candidatus Wallbacteria bacterium]|nr:hypothetical protein [Candidatus Wallbacteria bacterium]